MGHGGADGCEDFVDGDGEDAFLLLLDAGFEAAAGALDAVVEDAVVGAVGEPLARDVARGEDGDAGRADGGGEVHGAGVVADEEARAGEGGGGFAWGEAAAEVDDRGSAGALPVGGGEVAGAGFFRRAGEQEGAVGEGAGEAGEELAPVVAAPVFGLNFCADADGEELVLQGVGANGADGGGVLGRGEVEVPGGGVVEMSVAEFAKVAGEARGFGLEVAVGGCRGFVTEVVELGGGGERDADLAGDADEAEELRVATGGVEAAGTGEVDDDVGAEAADGDGEAEELADGACASGVAHVAVDKACVLEHGGGGWGLGGDGEVGEEEALGGGEGTRDEVEGGESDECVAEAAKAVDQDTPDGISHGSQCSRDILVVVDDGRGTHCEVAGSGDSGVA